MGVFAAHPPSHCPISLQILFSLACICSLFLLPHRFVSFSEGNLLLQPLFTQLLTPFLGFPLAKIKQTKDQTSVPPAHLCVPNKAIIFPLESENLGLLWVNQPVFPTLGMTGSTCHHAYQLKRNQKLLFLQRSLFSGERGKKSFSSFAKSNIVILL